MGFQFVGSRRSRPILIARPFTVKLTRHEPRIFARIKLV
jgi:hypothetical protein